jgi:hypothetical protein
MVEGDSHRERQTGSCGEPRVQLDGADRIETLLQEGSLRTACTRRFFEYVSAGHRRDERDDVFADYPTTIMVGKVLKIR